MRKKHNQSKKLEKIVSQSSKKCEQSSKRQFEIVIRSIIYPIDNMSLGERVYVGGRGGDGYTNQYIPVGEYIGGRGGG